MSDFNTIKQWLKLPPTQRTLAVLVVVCVVFFKMLQSERGKYDFYRDNAEREANKKCKQQIEDLTLENRDLKKQLSDSREEVKLIYKREAEEYKQAKAEVEAIKKNSTIIKKKSEKLVREQ